MRPRLEGRSLALAGVVLAAAGIVAIVVARTQGASPWIFVAIAVPVWLGGRLVVRAREQLRPPPAYLEVPLPVGRAREEAVRVARAELPVVAVDGAGDRVLVRFAVDGEGSETLELRLSALTPESTLLSFAARSRDALERVVSAYRAATGAR